VAGRNGHGRARAPVRRRCLRLEVAGDAWGLAVSDEAARDGGFRHAAWLYHARSEYLDGIRKFVASGLARGEPVFVAVPGSQLPGDWLPGDPSLTVADMRELGGNPARLIPALRAFADRYPGRRLRYLGESVWAGRSGAELLEAARHEALLNHAFASAQISAMCPYNAAELSAAVLADVYGTHPTLHGDDGERANADYRGPAAWPDSLTKPLLAPASAQVLSYDGDLRPVRALVAAAAGQAGLSPGRCTDFVIAASEVAANTLRHTSGGGVVRVWATDAEVLCQLEDTGFITDPLAGHWRPAGDLAGGQGLWLVNQICDLAEIRTSELGTTIRLHMYRR
jgi:anti-sigma regulatory factor (Ser/Thr protein kinase)